MLSDAFGLRFWRVEAVAWTMTYVLLIVAALPHISERDVFRYNTVGCVALFCLTLGVRPLCRAASACWVHSWLGFQACALAFSLVLGVFASFATGLGTFGWARLNGSNWALSWLQSGAVIFLWCNFYMGIEHWRGRDGKVSGLRSARSETHEFATQFAIRAGSRIQVVYEKDVLWVSAARDYAELHTACGTFLLRETMQSLQRRLDPERFVRIHRSRIVRRDQISVLTKEDNGEYRVKLLDGSLHRSSRTFAPALDKWLRFGTR